MTPIEDSQLSAEVERAPLNTAIQTSEPAVVLPATDRPLTREQQISKVQELRQRLAQLDPEHASRRRAREALARVTTTGLTINERCQAYSAIVDTTEHLDQHVALLDKGREMDRKARRLESLRAARLAPRCEHIKSNTQRCGSPAVGGQRFCFFHNLARNNAFEFPVVEDRRALQVAILRVCERLANGTIAPANAKILLQALTMASENAERMACEEEG